MLAWPTDALDAMLDRVFAQLRPRDPLSPLEWAERYRYLSPEENPDYSGPFDSRNIPALRGVLAAAGDPSIRRIVGQKSAQLAWTAGVVCTLMGYHVHWRPCVQVAMFPREKSAKDFDAEKFSPMVRATSSLAKRIRLRSRADGNSATRKHYAGGLLKFVASNSPSDVKSTSAGALYVEEPDDTNKDVKGQGNTIALLKERGKSISRMRIVIGGTPTAKGASEIEKEMRTTDQRRFMVTCHLCGEAHELNHDNIKIPGYGLSSEELNAPDIDTRYPMREVYGRARWEEAYYACPNCGGAWTDQDRVAAIRTAAEDGPDYGWVKTADSQDAGFYYNELQSSFPGSYVPIIAEKFLTAEAEMERGEPQKMIAYWNSSRGLPWEYKGELPEEDELRNRADAYAEWSCPAGGLVPTLTVDVQHDRLACTVWVHGRGEEMWLAYWGEVYGATIVAGQGAWVELEQLMDRTVRHATGASLRIAAVAIDSGDGQTSEAVYGFIRTQEIRRPGLPVLAVKGASETEGRLEIWTPPRKIDPNAKATKAAKYGVQVHSVGTAKAKDLILGWATEAGRVRLQGSGPGRMHWYETVRPDFYEQILSEIKIPDRTNPRRRHWKHRTDRRNEALDCTVYAIWLARQQRLHVRKPVQWDLIELRLRQGSLIAEAPADALPPVATPAPTLTPVQTSAPEAPAAVESAPTDVSAQLAAARFAQMLKTRREARHGR